MKTHLAIVVGLTLISHIQLVHSKTEKIKGEFNVKYNKTINKDTSVEFEYHHNHTEDSVVRLTTTALGKGDTHDFPMQIVVRQQLIVQSWNLPLEMAQGLKFPSVSRTLCSTGQQVNTTLPVIVEAETFSEEDIKLQLYAELLLNFTIGLTDHYNIYVSPSTPTYYQYTFENKRDQRSVTLHAISSQNYYCSAGHIQAAKCPVEDLVGQDTSADGVISQTFLTKAAVIIDKKPNSDAVFIIFTVAPSDQSCANTDMILPIGETKLKNIEFWIESHIDDTVYIFAVLAALGYALLFYFVALISCIAGRFWRKRQDRLADGEQLLEREQESESDHIEAASTVRTYGATAAVNVPGEDNLDNSCDLTGVDQLEDIEESKYVYRMKKHLMVSDMAKKHYTTLRKKYMLYWWNVITISIFYGLPVVQLVLTYQQYLNLSGNTDTCYYNFQCARKLGVLHNFNNIISNIGYVLLGILFIVIVRLRHRRVEKMAEHKRDKYGIPQHYGIFYAMGWALTIEGIMSASYHVCPSSNNFQFDTAFMYILGGLIVLRLFQSRHPDINANARAAFFLLALIIAIAVIGVLFNTSAFWYCFTVFYLIVVFYMTLQIYYVGRFKFDRSLAQTVILYIRSDCCRCGYPAYKARFGLLAVLNLINWGVGIFGVVEQPKDFATFMLGIIVLNLFGYCIFYVGMKLAHREWIPIQSIVLAVIAAILWGFALYLFTHNLTDWMTTPAKSRNLNADCMILDFFDSHDVWHFLSAGGMFCSFMAVLYIDDHLEKVPRTQIVVF